MTLSVDGVRLNVRQRNWGLTAMILAAEAVLSFFLYVSFAAHILWPDSTHAAVGVSTLLSYEGRLMDASGNPLGGTGEPYCFRFAIYDSSSGGTKLWPAGTPNVSVSTTTDGVFNALVGQADALTYNFYDSDTVYLNVDVNTSTSTNGTTCSGSWESLSPRQQIAATGYSEAAKNVYGDMLKTNISANRVDIGAGTGSSNPVLLALDVNTSNEYVGQTCSTNGTIWYNSAQSQALICEGGTIQGIGTAATTTIAALQTNGNAPISAGTVFFSNGNGVSWGNNGQTITASIIPAGGATLQRYEYPHDQFTSLGAIGQGSLSVKHMYVPFNVTGTAIRIGGSLSAATNTSVTTASANMSLYVGVYTLNGSTLSLASSGSANNGFQWSVSNSSTGNSSINSMRMMTVPININMTPGEYWIAAVISSATTYTSAAFTMYGGNLINNAATAAVLSPIGSNTTANKDVIFYQGIYTAATGNLPTNIQNSQINNSSASNVQRANFYNLILNATY